MSNDFTSSAPADTTLADTASTGTASVSRAAGIGAAVLEPSAVERIHADHISVKRLGNWTRADRFELRVRGGSVTLDLRSPELPADIEIAVEMERAMVKLLLPDGAILQHWDLAWTGRGKVKDSQGPSAAPADADQSTKPGALATTATTATTAAAAESPAVPASPAASSSSAASASTTGVRRVRLSGNARNSEVRINRGGVAILAAMCSKEYVEDLRRAHKSGVYPTVDDPARAAMSFR